MRQAVADVIEFMQAMGQAVWNKPGRPSPEVGELRYELIEEESAELMNAIQDNNLAEIADGCADLIYVTIGTALAYGIDLTPVWAAVHAANLTKATGPVLPSGKRGKPPGFKHPNIEAILDSQPLICMAYPEPIVTVLPDGDVYEGEGK